MPKVVVNYLKTIEVKKKHGKSGDRVCSLALDGGPEMVHKLGPVRQVGQCIVTGIITEFFFALFLFVNVRVRPEPLDNVSFCVAAARGPRVIPVDPIVPEQTELHHNLSFGLGGMSERGLELYIYPVMPLWASFSRQIPFQYSLSDFSAIGAIRPSYKCPGRKTK